MPPTVLAPSAPERLYAARATPDGAAVAPETPDLASYDRVVVMFSGGKDSLACLLTLLEQGVARDRLELWHHEIDGREGSHLMDWPCAPDYCRKVAAAFELPIYFSWRVGGFEGEMLRQEARTQPTAFEVPGGDIVTLGGDRGSFSTRRRFPQVSADLSVRWCSAYLKIMVASLALNNQARFLGRRTLVVTGERAAESAGRARYAAFEPHASDARRSGKRHVDHWRPIHQWSTEEVWDIIARWRVNPAPPYRLGFGRMSCMKCIFGTADQWATVRAIDPEGFAAIASYESQFGSTIHRSLTVVEQAARGTPYATLDLADIAAARATTFDEPVILPEGAWRLPSGAYGPSCGPI